MPYPISCVTAKSTKAGPIEPNRSSSSNGVDFPSQAGVIWRGRGWSSAQCALAA
jgi:hypothetical protein